jgi:monofunctional biosynthetic peptidoglycan transglycosylase
MVTPPRAKRKPSARPSPTAHWPSLPPIGQRRRSWAPLIGRFVLGALAILAIGPPLLVAIYRIVPPPITILMVERMIQGQSLTKAWVPLSAISPSLAQAVIAAEDARFCEHHGFDFKAMQAAAAHNARHPGKLRGGSTLSQQTAKNVFLWPGRSYVRKAAEAYFTVLIEALWGKRRILETYLNVAEWGPGVFGAEAASQRYFGHDAAHLTPEESARLAAILPDPLKWKAVHPGRYVARRTRHITASAATVRDDGLMACLRE